MSTTKKSNYKLYLSILILGVIIYIWKDTVSEKGKKKRKERVKISIPHTKCS
jgi:hypothetical protein